MSPKVKFVYFDGRGIAEPARLILHYANIDFEDVRVSIEEWQEMKTKTKTGKVPYLEFDGHTIVESFAIFRFLVRKYGLAGKDEYEQALVDGIADIQKDFYASVMPWLYAKAGFRPGNVDELKKPHFYDSVESYIPIFQNFLNESKSGFLAPSGLTWADFCVSEYLFTLLRQESTILDKYPEMKEYLKRIKEIPQLKEYYSSRKNRFSESVEDS
uniref:glutathione transferase n=1 Tax=Panagrolaimus davidi TaxID=227884 RepID=A0A914PAC9_9BILA